VQAIRNLFSRAGGSLGESGCVALVIPAESVINVKAEDVDKDELALKVIDLGADDVNY